MLPEYARPDLTQMMWLSPIWAKCLEWVGDLPEWVGFRPPSLHVKSCSAVADNKRNLLSRMQKCVCSYARTSKYDRITISHENWECFYWINPSSHSTAAAGSELSKISQVSEIFDKYRWSMDCLLGLYWTGLTLLNGFSFLVNFFFFLLDRAVD